MLFLSALKDVSHCCLISWTFLHAFPTSRPGRSLSAFSSHTSHRLFRPLQSKRWDSTFVCVKEKACVKSILPALSSSLAFFLGASLACSVIYNESNAEDLPYCYYFFMKHWVIGLLENLWRCYLPYQTLRFLCWKLSPYFAVTYTCCCRKKMEFIHDAFSFDHK